MTLPINKNDIPVDLPPNRECIGLPKMYQAANHPKKKPGPGNAYYYLLDTSKEGLQRVCDLDKTRKLPQGLEQDALNEGYMKLEEGDIVFVRSLMSPSDGTKDQTVCWVTGRNILTPELEAELIAARDQCLGPRSQRSRKAPQKGQNTGWSKFERDGNAHPVHDNTRCYPLGNSSELQTKIMAPCADGKIVGNQHAESVKMRKNLVKPGSALAMRAMEAGPDEILEHIKINAQIINAPATGVHDNIAYSAVQLNIAPAEPFQSKIPLSASMGVFGGEHRDRNDDPGYFTRLLSLPDLPGGYDSGRFFLFESGTFITLDPFMGINFCGLRFHGGTGPRAPLGGSAEDLEWAMRFTLIHYTPRGQTVGEQRYALGALPDNSTFFIPPEFTRIDWNERGWCPHATYAEDGHVLQDSLSQAEFFARSMYCATLWFMKQLPQELDMRIDMNEYFRAFSFINADGQRQMLEPWELGPGSRRLQTMHPPKANIIANSDFYDQFHIRQALARKWQQYRHYAACHIPYAVCKANGEEPMTADEIGVQWGGLDSDYEDGEPEIDTLQTSQAAPPLHGGRPSVTRPTRSKRPLTEPGPSVTAKKRKGVSGKAVVKESQHVENVARSWHPTTILERVIVERSTPPPPRRSARNKGRSTESAPSTRFQLGHLWNEDVVMGNASEDEDEDSNTIDIVQQSSDLTPTFLLELTTKLLKSELEDVRSAVIAAVALTMSQNIETPMPDLQALQTALVNSPLSPNLLPTINAGWRGLHMLNMQTQEGSLILRKQRATTMLMNYAMWYWLDVYIGDLVLALLEGRHHDDSWLASLVKAVEELYQLKITNHTFIATSYGVHLPNAKHTVSLSGHWPRQPKQLTCITSVVVEIIQNWLEFPHHPNARAQAWFVHVIIHNFGRNLLYLDKIWQTHTHVVKNLFRRGSWHLDSFKCMKPLSEAAPHHPLFSPQSDESQAVSEIGTLLDNFFSGRLSINQDVDSQADHAPLLKDQLPTSLQQVTDARMGAFLKFLQDSLAFILSTGDPPLYPELQKRFQRVPDRLIPFRELAPSRVRFKGDDGPFTKDLIRTTRGIFSAVVWRAITFSSPFSLQKEMVFDSAEDFDSIRAEAGPQPKTFFCQKNAYGVPTQRNVDLAHVYWASLPNDLWPAFVGDRCVPFPEMYRWVMYNKDQKARFPQLGPLGGYLLTADLVYAGVVTPPSSGDISLVIRNLNKGAASAFEELGLITPRPIGTKNQPPPKIEECSAAFKHIYDIMKNAIPTHLHEQLCFDNIMVEHTLCKFSRASNKSWLK